MLLGLIVALGVQTGAPPQPMDLAPGTRYDPRIPTLEQVLGHRTGEEITPPDGIVTYLKALASAAPDRTRLVEYAHTWEGRPLHVLAIASPQRIAELDRIKADMKRLAWPRGLAAADADKLVRELPVITWLVHAVHGNEISSSDAALAEAYHLLAALADPAVDLILRESIVLIDPLENPDGRARFVGQNLMGRAATPDPEPASAEHDEPWPGGRTNHYLFDMNRDYLSISQPETAGRVKVFLEWYPQVVVDLHEMSGNSTYYFAPPADPRNPYITKQQLDWFDTFGKANGRKFDERGFAYFVREVYDSFYPGYGESWPIFQGAIGMTYEQASSRGLVFRRDDEALLTYKDGVTHHFTAAITTAETAARNRERLLRDFLEYRRSAIQDGERGAVREYYIAAGDDRPRAERLARLLVRHGIEVRQAEEPVRAGTRTLPAGTFIVPVAQPAGRLVRNLLDPHVPMGEAFIQEQERRRKRRLDEQIYDVTAWSLPLVYDVELLTSGVVSGVRSVPWDGGTPAPKASLPAAQVGYILPWGSGAATAAVEALRSGLIIRTTDRPFTLGGRKYPAGTALLRAAENGPGLRETLAAIVARYGVDVVPTDTAFPDEGMSLGSAQARFVKAPRVLLAWDAPTQSLSAGWARYVLERRFGQVVSAVRVSSLGRIDMDRYDVLVLPAGIYATFNEDALRRLKDWIRGGGTLVTLGEASRWASGEKVGLLGTHTELKGGRPDIEETGKDDKKAGDPPKSFDLEKAIQPDRERPDALPGALLRVMLDQEHWLSAGLDGEIQAMVDGNRIFTPIKLDKGRNVGVYATKDRLVASGLVWQESQEQLAQKAFLIHQPIGQGHVIAFAEDPNFRAFTEATELLFINAVLLGPAH